MSEPSQPPDPAEEAPARHTQEASAVPPGTPVETPILESETDRLASAVTGPEDQIGMAALWRVTMQLENWWFLAVGEEEQESPAAAEIEGQQMLLAFTDAERVRHFALEQGMITSEDDLRAIALEPYEVVEAADTYQRANITGLIFDPHISGYYIPAEQLPVVWDAVMSPETETSQPIPSRQEREESGPDEWPLTSDEGG